MNTARTFSEATSSDSFKRLAHSRRDVNLVVLLVSKHERGDYAVAGGDSRGTGCGHHPSNSNALCFELF